MTAAIGPGGTIGILGGGQLGRMIALAAARLGLKTHVFDPVAGGPAEQVSAAATIADFDDSDALGSFAAGVDVVTFEFENVPETALDRIEALVPVRPGRTALAISQDRLTEKRFLRELGLGTAPFEEIASAEVLTEVASRMGYPSILKTRRFGYDGKGQLRLTGDADLAEAAALVAAAPSILEGFVPFSTEISVIGARSLDGAIACFDPGENRHEDGILRTTQVPARVPRTVLTDAVLATGKILSALDYVGVIGVEYFVVGQNLLVNEFAPRVHNSGHWTQNACTIDQFEQHVRAIAGWPLGPATRHADAVMTNLIGDAVSGWDDVVEHALHLYGKAEARPGRKMGHINRISPRG